MPESVRVWTLSVCVVCVAGAMLSMLFPEAGFKKLLHLIVSMMILCTVFRPLTSLGQWLAEVETRQWDVQLYENQALEDEIQQNAKSLYAAYTEDNIKRLLDSASVSYERIAVTMDNSDDGCISMGQVEVIVKKEDEAQRETIKRVLRDTFGVEPIVRAEP